ncbi:MAG: hypothetical protein H0U89_00620 [Acidimicrobiia bacterium]|nr:hypothetical protein [Acidimicrobiia bacterium]
MASLSFEGETHDEIVLKVKRWLQSLEGGTEVTRMTPVEAVQRGAELTKDALRVIAAAAPEPIADTDLMRSLTGMGYKATDVTREAVVAGLDAVDQVTGGSVVKRVDDTARNILYEMNVAVARQVLKALRGATSG